MDHLYQLLFLAQENLGPAAGGAAAGTGAAAPTGGPPPGACGGAGGMNMIFILLMLVVFYFLLIRPQQKRAKQHRELIGALKRGDNVITSSGIYGRIVDIDGNVVTLEIAKQTKIRILKNYVGGIANPDTEKQLAQSSQNA